MSNIDIQSNPFLQSVSSAATHAKNEAEANDELGQDAFLKLMIAQLENQDPLSPAENGEFIAQLAQFSSVEGITNLNTSVNSLVSEFRSSRALEASALVGRVVEVGSNTGRLPENGQLFGSLDIPAGARDVEIRVETLLGEVAHTELMAGPQTAGNLAFSWDGAGEDGSSWSAGTYRLRATGLVDGESVEIPINVAANVNSVSIGANNSMTLAVDGVGDIDVSDVKRFF